MSFKLRHISTIKGAFRPKAASIASTGTSLARDSVVREIQIKAKSGRNAI